MLKTHLKWWLSLANITQGRSLILSQQTVTITTDASLTGWGGHMKNKTSPLCKLWTGLVLNLICLHLSKILVEQGDSALSLGLVLIFVSPDLHQTNCPDISPDEYFVFLSVMPLPTPLL
jgi:hypothetical protein